MMVQFDVKRVQKGTESFMVSFDFTKTPITQIVDYIIISASKHNSSDIHFDPRGNGMMVRFRIDGDLQDYTYVPKAYERNLTTRLKLLANMNITESRLPQDGAIKGNFGDQYLDMRVSALPLNEGEKIVVRILDYSRSLNGVETLGFHPKNLEKIKRMISIPNGIILTTGATGSGKSTTTYSMLQELNKPETNIITVEDPIEMNIEGINQVQVNSEIGMTFAAALRSILRQDPNIILIGEIRDSETAQIAVRASITGHLVLSTIHTNNALATVERLLDMDVERYLLATSLTGIISQRLAKMLCPDCHYQRETTKYEKKVFKKYMNMDVAHVWDANPKGCDHCRRGYRGRIAIHEVLEIDDDVRSALNNDRLEKKELAKMVYSGNTITMLQDALIKCLEGKTSFEEVYKNIEIENEDDDNYENEMATTIKESIPKDEYVPENFDDLEDSPVKKNTENDISTMIVPPPFTAADFDDTPKEEEQKSNNNTTTAGVNNNVQTTSRAVNKVVNANMTQPVTNVNNTNMTQPVTNSTQVAQPTNVTATQKVVAVPNVKNQNGQQAVKQVSGVIHPMDTVTATGAVANGTNLNTATNFSTSNASNQRNAVNAVQANTNLDANNFVQKTVGTPVAQTVNSNSSPVVSTSLESQINKMATQPLTPSIPAATQQTGANVVQQDINNYPKLDDSQAPLIPTIK